MINAPSSMSDLKWNAKCVGWTLMFENVAKTKIKKFNIGLFSWRLSPPDIRITSLNCIFQFTASLMLALNLLKAFENFCLVWVR